MVEAISAKYGTATRPDAKIILFSSFHVAVLIPDS
jgi:hypothetical protein